MKKIIFFSLIIAFFAQISLFSTIGFWQEGWQFLTVALLLVVFSQRRLAESFFWLFLGGFLLDSFSALPFGFYCLALLSMLILIKSAERVIPIKEKGKKYFIVLALFLTGSFLALELAFFNLIHLLNQLFFGLQAKKEIGFSIKISHFLFLFIFVNWWNLFF